METTNKRRAIVLSVLLALTIVALTGPLSTLQQKVILPPAENYIEESQEKALKSFVTISIVKGIVAVIEGSDVAGIEVGDIVQPLYDSINITWELITASLATLYILEIVLTLCRILGTGLLAIVFILTGILQFVSSSTLKRSIYFFAVFAFTFYLAIPTSLYLSGKLSSSYSDDILSEFDTEMNNFKNEYEARLEVAQNAGLIEIDGWPPRLSGSFPEFYIHWPDIQTMTSPKYQIIADIFTDMQGLIQVMPELLFRTGATWLLDVMIIPLGMLFLLYKLCILFIKTFIDDARSERLREGVANSLKNKFRKVD